LFWEGEVMKYFRCDTCGNQYAEGEFAETIEEMLCQWCASGIDDYDDDCSFDGQETCNDEYDEY